MRRWVKEAAEDIRRPPADVAEGVSHDLRTPLTVIQAEVDLALARPRDTDYYRRVLERIALEQTRLGRALDEFLGLIRRSPAQERPGGALRERAPASDETHRP